MDTQSIKTCLFCGVNFLPNIKESKAIQARRQFCSRGCAGRWRSTQKPPKQLHFPVRPDYGLYIAKPGQHGYMRQWAPQHPVAHKDGLVLVHRQVWYDAYGSIPPGFQIHHKNGNRQDNRLENLEIVENGEHQRLHHSEPGSIRKNQYGEHLVMSLEDRRERDRRRRLWYSWGNKESPPADWVAPPRKVQWKARKT